MNDRDNTLPTNGKRIFNAKFRKTEGVACFTPGKVEALDIVA